MAQKQHQLVIAQQEKEELEAKLAEAEKAPKDASINMQDSVVGGDALASGSTKIETQTVNDAGAIAKAALEAYKQGLNDSKED